VASRSSSTRDHLRGAGWSIDTQLRVRRLLTLDSLRRYGDDGVGGRYVPPSRMTRMASAITFGNNVLGRNPTAPLSSAARTRSSSALAEITATRALGTSLRNRSSASSPEQPGSP